MGNHLPTNVTTRSLKRGWLIVFEGIDGTGKTTQSKLLCERLRENGYPALLLHEPTTGKWGQKIGELAKYGRDKIDAQTELNFFILDRKDDVEKNITPALCEKKIVIMDRYYLSSVAYQGAIGLNPQNIEAENEKIAPKPDLAIILDLSVEVAVTRISKKRTSDHFENMNYLEKVRDIFLNMYDTRPWVRIVKGNCSRTTEDIASEIWEIVYPLVSAEEI